MITILNIDKDKFSLNGIPYFKNFMPHVIGSELRIVNVYDTTFELSPPNNASQYTVNGVVYTTVLALQTALLSIVYSRDTLGAINEFFLGSIVPSSVPTGTGKAFWIATEAGTYTNFGGVIVNANSRAEISRDAAGVFSISQTPLDLSTYQKIVDGNKINPWVAQAYPIGSQTNKDGKDWVLPTVAALSTDIPGVSSKWVERLSGYGSKENIDAISPNLYLFKGADLVGSATYVDGRYITVNGISQGNSALRHTPFLSIKGQTQLKYVSSNGLQIPTYTYTAFYDANQVYISEVTGTASGGTVNVPTTAVYFRTTVATGATVRMEVQTGVELNVFQKIVDGNKINTWTAKSYLSGDQVNYLGKDWVSNAATLSTDVPATSSKWVERLTAYSTLDIKSALSESLYVFSGFDLVGSASYVDNKYIDINGASLTNSMLRHTPFLSIKGQTQLKYVSSNGLQIPTYTYTAFYDANQVYISGVTGTASGGTVNVPTTAVYFRTTVATGATVRVEAMNNVAFPITVKSELYGKKIYCLGDSITAGSTSAKPYPTLLNGLGAIATNYGIGGTEMGGTDADAFVNRMSALDVNSDYLITMGGTNDFLHNTPMGVITDTTNATFYGSLDLICKIKLNRFKNQKTAFITPIKISDTAFNEVTGGVNALGKTLLDYSKAIKEVANKYGIPVLDLNSSCGINPNIAENKALYFANDGCHPTTAGDVKIFSQIKRFIESL